MLAVVLAGIGIGALIASAIWTRFPMLSYSGFVAEPARYETTSVVIDSLRLMPPVSILSGVFFTVIGRAVERELGEESRAAALVTFANTIGAAIGPIVAGFVLIPTIGVEGSFFTIGVLYVVIALLALRNRISLIPIAIAAVTRRSDRNGCLSAQRERQIDSSIARCSSSWACPRRVHPEFYAAF